MKKNKQIKDILEELYSLDEEFRGREEDLVKILNKLMKNKPEIKIDSNFVSKLKKELIKEAREMNTEKPFSYLDVFSNKWFLIPAGAGVLTVFLLVFSFFFSGQFFYENQYKVASDPEISSGLEIEKLEDNAFGVLALDEGAREGEQSLGVDGGGQLTKPSSPNAPLGLGSAEMDGIARMPEIIPNRINYEFIYRGEDFIQDKNKLSVFKKIPQDSLKKSFSNSFSNLNLGLIDLSRFQNLEATHLNLVEDKDFAYFVNFDFSNGSISVNKDWSNWPSPEKDCQDNSACYEAFRLKIDDIPDDQSIISLTDEFLDKFGVDRGLYAKPQVQDYWRKNYLLSNNKENFYVPSEVSVVYPFKINDQNVYEESGEVTGLYVSLDIRNKKVSGLRNLFNLNFQSSDYEVISNSEKIVSIAEDGGLRRVYNHDDPTETVIIELGSPSLGLVKVWNFDYDSNENNELFVPAYIFPVDSVSEETYYNAENIIVPLVDEFMRKDEPVFRIMEGSGLE